MQPAITLTDRERSPGRAPVDLALVLLAAGVLINLLVIWMPAAVGSMDGPIHLAAATDLRLWLTDPASLSHTYLEPAWPLVPNMTGELLMVGLLAVLDPGQAEQV